MLQTRTRAKGVKLALQQRGHVKSTPEAGIVLSKPLVCTEVRRVANSSRLALVFQVLVVGTYEWLILKGVR